jgi:hypothetical protein
VSPHGVTLTIPHRIDIGVTDIYPYWDGYISILGWIYNQTGMDKNPVLAGWEKNDQLYNFFCFL